MGIPSYFRYVLRHYRGSFLKQAPRNVSSLLIDSNSLIYDVVREHVDVVDEEVLIRYVCGKIDALIQKAKPHRHVVVAFDGVAPLAKMQQQRTRRCKNYVLQQDGEEGKEEKTKSVSFDLAMLTPGTTFMARLSDVVPAYMAQHHPSLEVVVYGSETHPGEGEQKLFAWMRQQAKGKMTSVMVYGLDADLLMLALCHREYCGVLTVFREDTNDAMMYLDIGGLATAILHQMGFRKRKQEQKQNEKQNEKQEGKEKEEEQRVVVDYLLLCFLLGNDFLPPVLALPLRTDGLQRLLDAYQKTCSSSTSTTSCCLVLPDNTIDWTQLNKLLRQLAVHESSWLAHDFQQRQHMATQLLQQQQEQQQQQQVQHHQQVDVDDLPLWFRGDEVYVAPGTRGWQARYYRLFGTEGKEDMARRYKSMLQWILFYYVRGCDDWWACYPYASAPLLEDLAQSVAIVLHDDVATTPAWRSQPVTQQAQLMYVLPQAKLRCLRKQEQAQAQDRKQEQAQDRKQEQRKQEQVDEKYAFHWMGCRYFWEAHLEQHDAEDKLMACCDK